MSPARVLTSSQPPATWCPLRPTDVDHVGFRVQDDPADAGVAGEASNRLARNRVGKLKITRRRTAQPLDRFE